MARHFGMIADMQALQLRTEKMAFEGRAIARWGRFVIFIEGALPGELVTAEITRRKRRYAYARLLGIVEPSPHRVTPRCPVFTECGGCAFQNMEYRAQLDMKRDVLIESLHGVPGVATAMRPMLPCEEIFNFRNKMVFSFGIRDGQAVLGLHARGDWQTVVDASSCRLPSPEATAIVADAIRFVRERNIPVWHDAAHTGLLRHLVIREGKHTGERMIHIHAAAWDPALEAFHPMLAPRCATLLVSAHANVPEAAPPEATRVMAGNGVIHESLNGLVFEIGPTTFFQTNTLQAERMFALLMQWVEEIQPSYVADLYAGTGPIAAHLSRIAKRVLAIESNPASVEAARRNFALNNIRNVDILRGEVEKRADEILKEPCDLIVVDPPRPGLHRRAVEFLLQRITPALIYISCNPATLARDLKLLTAAGYRIDRIQPVDLFPHAFHIETLVLLRPS
jgi:23S rRNA (uracil1939-C5)-methyltransferase